MIFDHDDIFNLIMQGKDISTTPLLVDPPVDLETAALILENVPSFVQYDQAIEQMTISEFDQRKQQTWFMPEEYQQLDIAKHVLDLCESPEQLQRAGEELLMYQERNLFDLLRYLKYLVDVMKQNRLIWGVGRGSSLSSYVLYLMEVHRIDSMYYDLDPKEFLR